MCVNWKELVVLFQRNVICVEPEYSFSTHMLNDHLFKLTKFVNDYFSQNDTNLKTFLESEPYLELLELHPACPPQFLHGSYSMLRQAELRLDFENSLESIYWKQKQSYFSEIIRVIALKHMDIRHLEIHQFFPTQTLRKEIINVTGGLQSY